MEKCRYCETFPCSCTLCVRCGFAVEVLNATFCQECAEELKIEQRDENESGSDRCPPRE